MVPHRHRPRRRKNSTRGGRLRLPRRQRKNALRSIHPNRPRRPRLQRHRRPCQPQLLSRPISPPAGELQRTAWTDPQVNARYVAFGNLSETTSEVAIEAWLYDVALLLPIRRWQNLSWRSDRCPSPQIRPPIRRRNHQQAVRRPARHRLHADRLHQLPSWLQGTLGHGLRRLKPAPATSLRTISLMPRWSPDASRIAFTCYPPKRRHKRPDMHVLDGRRQTYLLPPFPRHQQRPHLVPGRDANHVLLLHVGGSELFVTDINGSKPKRLTFSTGGSTSPAWNPKTGQSVAFVSDRGGIPKLYMMNADGTNVTNVDLPDKGYVIDPAWSPNGQLLAFSWRRPTATTTSTSWNPTPSASSISRRTPAAATNAPVGLPTAATSSSNPRATVRARSGPCSPTAPSLVS